MPRRLSYGYLRPLRLIPRVSYLPPYSDCTSITTSSYCQPPRKAKGFTCLDRYQQARTLHSQVSAGRADGRNDVFVLKSVLVEIQKQFQSYVNISRLQLALRGLEQYPGEETIRIAVLGCAGKEKISRTIRELVRLLVADPLKEEAEWERILIAENQGTPILLRIGQDTSGNALRFDMGSKLMRELNVSSPIFDKSRLEILILGVDVVSDSINRKESIIETILAPTVDIPISNAGRYSPVVIPVHKAMIIGEGILDAASLVNIPIDVNREVITSAVNLPGYIHEGRHNLPFSLINVGLAEKALLKFRESLDNATVYEQNWFNSGLPKLLDWLKDGTLNGLDGDRIKRPIQFLISSVLTDAKRRIKLEESRRASALLTYKAPSRVLKALRNDLEAWAERAHAELRDQLDLAFEGKRWSKLGWWKLFWRVDDVSMIASDIIERRFLSDAEKEIIYLAGKIEEAGVPKYLGASLAYKPIPKPPKSTIIESPPDDIYYEDIMERPYDDAIERIRPRPWPLHISIIRNYLLADTIPAFQALAQNIVLQTVTTSAFVSILSGLIYISSISTGLYEVGALAAIGAVWSLKRMQRKWETARSFWEGEVREEGRKAVRAVELVVGEVLKKAEGTSISTAGSEDLDQVKNAVERAEVALALAAGESR